MSDNRGDVWFVYDGDCPVCQIAASGLRIKKAVGNLHLVNAREDKDNAVLHEINKCGLNLDKGMVIKFQDAYYHGADALYIMALLGTNRGWFNRMNYLLFRSKFFAKICYPAMRATRNMAIRLKGVSKINNLYDKNQPTFKAVFGDMWEKVPPVIRTRYANRPYSNDKITVKGEMDITYSPIIRVLLPALKLFGALMPYDGKNIPATIHFHSEPDSNAFCFDRIMHYPYGQDGRFQSKMYPYKNNQVLEYIRFGIGLKLKYEYDGKDTVYLTHQGYFWKIFGILIPMPFSLIFGKAFGEEIAIDDNSFKMKAGARHFLFGTTFQYKGKFKITNPVTYD